jgi:hypothetical protein
VVLHSILVLDGDKASPFITAIRHLRNGKIEVAMGSFNVPLVVIGYSSGEAGTLRTRRRWLGNLKVHISRISYSLGFI